MANRCDLREVADLLRPYITRRVGTDHADDVLQDILHRVYESVGTIDDDTRYTAWLRRIAQNAIIDHHRCQKRIDAKHAAFAAEACAAEAFDPQTEANAGDETLAPFMGFFLDQLPSPYQEAVRLTELQGLTMKEAAESEAVSVSAMKSRVSRGRRLLRGLFEACCEITLDARGRVVDIAPR